MLDGNVKQYAFGVGKQLIEPGTNAGIVGADLCFRRPVRWLVGWQPTIHRIDAESKQLVELCVKWLDAESLSGNQIPVERFQVPQVKDQPMPLRNRAVIEGFGADQRKQGIRYLPSVRQTREKNLVTVAEESGRAKVINSPQGENDICPLHPGYQDYISFQKGEAKIMQNQVPIHLRSTSPSFRPAQLTS